MTLEEAKQLKEGQEIWYRGINNLPELVKISNIKTDSYGKLEIHLIDNCYIPERDLDYVFLKFDECMEVCRNHREKQLEILREMLKLKSELCNQQK